MVVVPALLLQLLASLSTLSVPPETGFRVLYKVQDDAWHLLRPTDAKFASCQRNFWGVGAQVEPEKGIVQEFCRQIIIG